MKGNDNRTVRSFLILALSTILFIPSACASGDADDSTKFILGASLNPALVVVSGGSFSSSPILSIQAKFPATKYNWRLAAEYLPSANTGFSTSERVIGQTDSTVSFVNEHHRDNTLRLVIGAERKLRTGRFTSYLGAEVFGQVDFYEFSAWNTIAQGDSIHPIDLESGTSVSDIGFGMGGRLFFGLSADLTRSLSASAEIAPTFVYAMGYSYEANDQLEIAKSRNDFMNFTSSPLIHLRVHYRFH